MWSSTSTHSELVTSLNIVWRNSHGCKSLGLKSTLKSLRRNHLCYSRSSLTWKHSRARRRWFRGSLRHGCGTGTRRPLSIYQQSIVGQVWTPSAIPTISRVGSIRGLSLRRYFVPVGRRVYTASIRSARRYDRPHHAFYCSHTSYRVNSQSQYRPCRRSGRPD